METDTSIMLGDITNTQIDERMEQEHAAIFAEAAIKAVDERVKSTNKVEVVPVTLETHPNADSLSIIRVFGFTVCGRTEDWQGIEKAAYIQPDSLVPLDNPLFEFLKDPKRPNKTHHHVKVKRLRGIMSQGLLVPAPEGTSIGDDVAELLGVTRYNPPEENQQGGFSRGEVIPGPSFHVPKYDVDSAHRYADKCFVEGEDIVVFEKIHGANGRFVFHDGQLFCGSRTEWKRYDPNNQWWKALLKYPQMISWLVLHPDTVVYGEVYGAVQDLNYGHLKGECSIGVFDIMNKDGQYMSIFDAMSSGHCLPWAPIIKDGESIVHKYDKTIFDLAEGDSLIPNANHIREGIVIRPTTERYNPIVGRVVLKIVSNSYLERP